MKIRPALLLKRTFATPYTAVLYYLFCEVRLSLKTVELALSVIYAVNS